jgi:hypothetical protein
MSLHDEQNDDLDCDSRRARYQLSEVDTGDVMSFMVMLGLVGEEGVSCSRPEQVGQDRAAQLSRRFLPEPATPFAGLG